MKYNCPHCGVELFGDVSPGDSGDCPNCGKEFVIPENETMPTPQEPTMTQTSHSENQNTHQIPALLKKGRCKHCGLQVLVGQNPCPHCGHELKWSQATVQNRRDRRKTETSGKHNATETLQPKRALQPDKPSLANSTMTNESQKNGTKMKNYLKTATLIALIGNGIKCAQDVYSGIYPILVSMFRDDVKFGWVWPQFVWFLGNISTFMFFLVLYLAQQKRNKRN